MRQYLARRGNVVDMNLWVSERRGTRRTAARNRERQERRRRLELEARVLPFRASPKAQDALEEKRLRVAGSIDPDLPEAS